MDFSFLSKNAGVFVNLLLMKQLFEETLLHMLFQWNQSSVSSVSVNE